MRERERCDAEKELAERLVVDERKANARVRRRTFEDNNYLRSLGRMGRDVI